MSGRGLGDWEEVFYEPELDFQPRNPEPSKHPLVHKNSSFMKSMEPEFLHDFGNGDSKNDAEDEKQKTYMYNIKTGSMIPSSYMLDIFPESKPQPKGRYDPE